MPKSENNILKEKKKKRDLSLSCKGFIQTISEGRIGEQGTESDQSNVPAVLWWVCSGHVFDIHARIGRKRVFLSFVSVQALSIHLSKQPPTCFPHSSIFIPASVPLDDVKINAKSMFVSLCKTSLPKLSQKERMSPECEHRDRISAV